jgi:hypothetical protein
VVYPVVRPRPTLAYSMLWRPNGRGLQSTPLKRSKDPLEYHGVLLSLTISRSRGISTTWSLSPLHFDVHKEAQSKGGMSNTHKTQNHSDNTHTSRNTTRRVHNSNRALDAITKKQMRGIEVSVLRNALSILDVLLHAPRGPFYSPKVARSR